LKTASLGTGIDLMTGHSRRRRGAKRMNRGANLGKCEKKCKEGGEGTRERTSIKAWLLINPIRLQDEYNA